MLVREEEVPEALGARLLAQLHDDPRVRDARTHLLVEGAHRLRLDGVHVLLHEGAHAVEQFGDAI